MYLGYLLSASNVDINADIDVDGHTNLDNISVAGVSTFTGDATFSGNVSIGRPLTYEDVTNVDAVGIVTARTGIDVNAGGINVDGGGLNIVGVSTFASNIDANGNLDVDGQTDLDVVNVAELATFSSRVQVGTGITLDQGNINLGEVTGIVTASSFVGGGDGKFVTAEWTVGANGSSHYTLTGPGGLSNADDPTIYLARGQTYQFVNNSGGNHPFEIRQSAGGSAYNTGVTNNGASAGIIKFEVPFAAPNTLVYQCQNHSSMVGNIVIYPST